MRVRLHRLSKARVALLALWAFAVLGPALGGGLWGVAAFWLLAPLAARYLVWPVIRRLWRTTIVQNLSGPGMPRLPGEPGYVPARERGASRNDGWYWRRGGDGACWRSRAAGGPWEPAERTPTGLRIEIDPEDAELLLGFCEPGSTLQRPSITETNYRRFLVAQADAERRRRLAAQRP